MRIAVIGSAGLVGAEVARRFSGSHDVLAWKHGELDIRDGPAVGAALAASRPDLVVNCAALGVDASESDPALAFEVNAAGPGHLATAARAIGAELVHFSSNYVFGGRPPRGAAYTIEDDPAPVNVYGRTKLEGERRVNERNPASFVVRTSWVFGSGKESFLGSAHRNLVAGRRIRAIRDVRASATYVRDLAERLEEIVALRRYGTYHVVNAGSCSYEEFAREAARLAGKTAAETADLIESVTEEEMRRGAPRPRETPMRCLLSERLGLSPMRHRREALAAYVRESAREVCA